MYQLQVEGIKETEAKLLNIKNLLPVRIAQGMKEAGDFAVDFLNREFPTLTFQGIFLGEGLEYWITTGGVRGEEGQIICVWSGKAVDIQKELQVGRKPGKGETPFTKEFNLDELTRRIGNDATRRIERIIQVLLK